MSDKYHNPEFNKLYKNFQKMFEVEGDVYGTIHKSIEDDLRSKVIPSTLHKTLVHQILDEASVDFFIKDISVLKIKNLKDEFKLK